MFPRASNPLTIAAESLTHLSQGTIGGILRALRHVPSFVRVVNEHTEEILVVVTKYHPNRLLTSGGLCVSNTGLSLNYDTTVRWPWFLSSQHCTDIWHRHSKPPRPRRFWPQTQTGKGRWESFHSGHGEKSLHSSAFLPVWRGSRSLRTIGSRLGQQCIFGTDRT